jgi:hypothetical protein
MKSESDQGVAHGRGAYGGQQCRVYGFRIMTIETGGSDPRDSRGQPSQGRFRRKPSDRPSSVVRE